MTVTSRCIWKALRGRYAARLCGGPPSLASGSLRGRYAARLCGGPPSLASGSLRGRYAALLLALALAPAGARGGELPLQDLEERIIEIAERAKPAVVHIEAIVRTNDRRKQVTGSGVITHADGRILTNHHVVDRAEKVTVSVPGVKRKYPARIVGTDMQTDIALLRIESDTTLPAARFGSIEDVRVGQWVLAIGNPYGLDGTVSFGIVSAKGRNLEVPETLNDFIQTDAMIDRGSSGGPLVDLEGFVIGINSRGQGRGIGFTIPIDTALEVAKQLEAGGIERGFIGITMQPLDRDLAEYWGRADLTGAVLNSVIEGSPAQRAGLETGDIVTRFDGTPVETEKEEDLGVFQRLVAGIEPGQKVKLEIVRDGKQRSVEVEVGTMPKVDPAEEETDVGLHVREITSNLARAHRLGSERGAFVHFVARGSPAAEARLYVGDVIERIEDDHIDDLENFRTAMRRVAGKKRFLITVRRGLETKFLLIKRDVEKLMPPEPAGDPGHAAYPGSDD
jgi:serine protease Do